jgi:hypothetical protein
MKLHNDSGMLLLVATVFCQHHHLRNREYTIADHKSQGFSSVPSFHMIKRKKKKEKRKKTNTAMARSVFHELLLIRGPRVVLKASTPTNAITKKCAATRNKTFLTQSKKKIGINTKTRKTQAYDCQGTLLQDHKITRSQESVMSPV